LPGGRSKSYLSRLHERVRSTICAEGTKRGSRKNCNYTGFPKKKGGEKKKEWWVKENGSAPQEPANQQPQGETVQMRLFKGIGRIGRGYTKKKKKAPPSIEDAAR